MDIVLIGYIALAATEKTLLIKESELNSRFSVSYLNKAKRACLDFTYNENYTDLTKVLEGRFTYENEKTFSCISYYSNGVWISWMWQ